MYWSTNIPPLHFVLLLPLTCFALRSGLDWRTFLDPGSYQQYVGKPHSYFNISLFQGDIASVDPDMSYQETSEMAANMVRNSNLRWPDNTVYYSISPTFSTSHVDIIERAMAAMSDLTDNCIKFLKQTDESDYVHILRGLGCYSAVGRQGGEQKLSLARGCMEALGDIQHELMHALGFFHEISRRDRDDFIEVNWDNIIKGQERQFEIFDGLTYGLPYDYESVMHYPWTAFAIDPSIPTILPKKKNTFIGQNENLSPIDQQRIRRAYKCPERATPAKKRRVTTTTMRRIPKIADDPEQTSPESPEEVVDHPEPVKFIRPTKTLKCPRNRISLMYVHTLSQTTIWDGVSTRFAHSTRASSLIKKVSEYTSLLTSTQAVFSGVIKSVETRTVNEQTTVLHTWLEDENRKGGRKSQEVFETRSWSCAT